MTVSLKDCIVQTFRSGGKGGQHQNKTESGVRVIHIESGARGEARDERSQLQNKRLAFERMQDSADFKAWLRHKSGLSARVIASVERDMWPDRIRVEYWVGGKWVEQ